MRSNQISNIPDTGGRQELPPIHRVPDDILREIFLHSLSDEVTLTTSEAPMLLCRICQYWRALAVDYAPLWTSLKLVINKGGMNVMLGDEELLPWFGRCKGLKIDFFIIVRRVSYSDDRAQVPIGHLFTFLSRSLAQVPAYKFRHLTLHSVPLKALQLLPQGALSYLESLVLDINPDPAEPPIDWQSKGPIRAFEQCSLLRRVALDGTSCLHPGLHDAIAILWNQLTHFFCLCELSPDDFLYCVAQMATLVHAYFGLGDENAGEIDPSSPQLELHSPIRTTVALHDLASLTLTYWGLSGARVDYPDFWRSFDFPNLHTLRIIGMKCAEMESPEYWDDQKSFMAKLTSLKRLQKLSIYLHELDLNASQILFRCCPSVTHLDLDISYDQYQAVLTALHGDRGYLPKLKALALEVGNSSAHRILDREGRPREDVVDVSALLTMVESRRSCGLDGQLERIDFYGREECEVSEVNRFYQCLGPYIEKGLIVKRKFEELFGHTRLDEPVSSWKEAGLLLQAY